MRIAAATVVKWSTLRQRARGAGVRSTIVPIAATKKSPRYFVAAAEEAKTAARVSQARSRDRRQRHAANSAAVAKRERPGSTYAVPVRYATMGLPR
ncbi:MAG TPA: hypothetical protein VGS98_05245 [Thermoanaerobaculia bacterium]|jgi:hypothetical protein|nr:hypothetical protein [Thermoanaerobaculia bacterium]